MKHEGEAKTMTKENTEDEGHDISALCKEWDMRRLAEAHVYSQLRRHWRIVFDIVRSDFGWCLSP
jgi:hypothetical protein